ncbi:MAG: metallophosphoesterase family protein [Chloroflexota bacterium]|nr:metallophosphatase family protein [Chloroflexota bacterium]
MKIGVISDTHAQTMEDIPWSILNAMEDVDLIVHTGDFTERAVLEGFRELGEVKAVYGNMDSGELKRMLPDKRTIEVAGRQIGLSHGSGGPWGMAERVRPLFGDIDIIIFGHSHLSFNEYIRGTLMFNPGRARDSYGIVTIEKEIEAEIVRV